MKASEIRKWIGLYLLVFTCVLAMFILGAVVDKERDYA
jgi:hypothetical protein